MFVTTCLIIIQWISSSLSLFLLHTWSYVLLSSYLHYTISSLFFSSKKKTTCQFSTWAHFSLSLQQLNKENLYIHKLELPLPPKKEIDINVTYWSMRPVRVVKVEALCLCFLGSSLWVCDDWEKKSLISELTISWQKCSRERMTKMLRKIAKNVDEKGWQKHSWEKMTKT